jgi:ribonucleoside-diphosphate reductase alpha chain
MVYNGEFNREKISKLVKLAVRFLDDVIEANALPLKQTEYITGQNRKIGLGVMGFADALIKLGIPYNSERALEAASSIMSFISEEVKRASEQLAAERGAFPNFKNSIYYSQNSRPLRNAALLSIAPTGSISILANCSSGIEPLFALSFIRNIMEGSQLLEVNPLFEETARKGGFYSESLMKKIASSGNLKGIIEIPEDVRRLFVTDWDIHWSWHVKMQAAFQRHVDNSVSKTINLPHEASVEDVRQAFLMAYETGCKGITVYRYGVKKEQVLNLGRYMQGESGTQKYTTAQSEYSGGCLHETCDF